MGIVAYTFFIPLIIDKESLFAMYHTNQGDESANMVNEHCN